MRTLFISDLHLQKKEPMLTEAFLKLLDNFPEDINDFYILGDLFEAWVGDDNLTPFHTLFMDKLKKLTACGINIFFMPGNRDFLLGKEFANYTGIQLLEDPTVITLYGTPTLLMHGDSLCTEDKSYMTFREKVRNPKFQRAFLSKPLWCRQFIAWLLRQKSRKATQKKADYLMDVTMDEVKNLMKKYQVNRLIHGHTHKPAIHYFELDGITCSRIVLGDWGPKPSYLIVDKEGVCRLTDKL